jgi:hypothetical protein
VNELLSICSCFVVGSQALGDPAKVPTVGMQANLPTLTRSVCSRSCPMDGELAGNIARSVVRNTVWCLCTKRTEAASIWVRWRCLVGKGALTALLFLIGLMDIIRRLPLALLARQFPVGSPKFGGDLQHHLLRAPRISAFPLHQSLHFSNRPVSVRLHARCEQQLGVSRHFGCMTEA